MLVHQQEDLNLALAKHKHWAFVPTMGALHAGHLSLIKQAKAAYSGVVCSIFVNPTQFNNPVDYEKYPVHLEQDLQLLATENCDLIFAPTVSEIYPKGLQVALKQYNLGPLEQVMEGKMRPGHYQGVAHVVRILLEKVRPAVLYLGEKDFQQIQVIRKMMELENIHIPIQMADTVRANSGLALSSRNARLSPKGLEIAAHLHQILLYLKENKMQIPINDLLEKAKEKLQNFPEISLEYLEIHPELDLSQPVFQWQTNVNYRAFIAANIENVRLIDTLKL